MKPNQHIVKTSHIELFMELCERIKQYPEQEYRIRELKQFLKKSSRGSPVRKVIAYHLHRVLLQPKVQYRFDPIEKPVKDYKVNLAEIRYSVEVADRHSITKNVVDFVYGFGGSVQEFLCGHYNGFSLVGILNKSLSEIYDEFNLEEEIDKSYRKHLAVTNFNKPKPRPKRKPEWKLPAIAFDKDEEQELLYYYKLQDFTTVSNMNPEQREHMDMLTEAYQKVGVVGVFVGGAFKTYIATFREKVIKGLMKKEAGGKFTLQNNFLWLNEASGKLNHSIKKFGGYCLFKSFERASGHMFYTMGSLLTYLTKRPECDILFRNHFLNHPTIRAVRGVVQSLDMVSEQVVVYSPGTGKEYTVNFNRMSDKVIIYEPVVVISVNKRNYGLKGN